jgi:mRNA interferase RelE/StbE
MNESVTAGVKIEISATAEKQLAALERDAQVRVVNAIRKLSENPRPRGCRKLRDYSDVYRIRVGVFRVLYCLEQLRLLILVLKIGHRRDVYR